MDPKHIIAIAAYHAKQAQNAISILRLFLGSLARFLFCIYIHHASAKNGFTSLKSAIISKLYLYIPSKRLYKRHGKRKRINKYNLSCAKTSAKKRLKTRIQASAIYSAIDSSLIYSLRGSIQAKPSPATPCNEATIKAAASFPAIAGMHIYHKP